MTDAILDTTFFIDLRKGNAGAEQLWAQLQAGRMTAAFSSMTAFELWVGEQFEEDDQQFYLGAFAILEEALLSAFAAAQAGTWLRLLSRRTRERRLRDALIAATALEREEPVFTRNLRDFARFPIKVETY